jgi:ABC-type spermidine/putrescine transport system permease subunit II
MDYSHRIVNLWTVFLLAMLFHTDLGLMPLFHDLSVAEFHGQTMSDVSPILWLMLVFFILPLFAIIVISFSQSRKVRQVHFGLTVAYSVLNLGHLIADLSLETIVWYQIFLMTFLFLLGLLINVVSWRWLRVFKSNVTHPASGFKI